MSNFNIPIKLDSYIESKQNIYKCLFFCSVGNILEWYDFAIYGALSPILAKVFFPEKTLFASLTLTFFIFAIGFFVRPIGGLFFGYIADKYGRKRALTYSVMLTAIPALSTALLPSYYYWGGSSAVLLLTFRVLQGFAVGGEYPALITYLSEIAPQKQRGYFCSYANVTTILGVLLSTMVLMLLNLFFSQKAVLDWAWRIPFAIAFFSVLLGFYFRLKLKESDIFSRFKQQNIISAGLWKKNLKKDSRNILKIFCVVFCAGVSYYTYNLFLVSYLTEQINFTYKQALILSLFGSFLLACFIPFLGFISDKIGRKKVIYIGIYGLIFIGPFLFYGFSPENFGRAFFIQIIFSILLACYFGTLPSLITEQLQVLSRGISVAIAYGISIALSGGTAPMINLYLIKALDNIYAPGMYIALSGVISLFGVFFMKEMYCKSLIE